MDYYHVLTSYTSSKCTSRNRGSIGVEDSSKVLCTDRSSSEYTPCKEYWKCYDSCLLKNNSEIIDEFKQCMSENHSYAKCAKESKQNCNIKNCIKNCTL